MASTVVRTVILRTCLLFVLIIFLEVFIRSIIVSSPSTVVALYLSRLGAPPRSIRPHGPQVRAEYVKRQCSLLHVKPKLGDSTDFTKYLAYKSPGGQAKNLVTCIPGRLGSKSVVEDISRSYGLPCYNNLDKQPNSCSINETLDMEGETVKAAFILHPLDRLIIEFRRSQHKKPPIEATQTLPGRKLLHLAKKHWKKKKKNKIAFEFSTFINDVVLSSQSESVRPISEVCNVCSGSYDLVVDLRATKGTEVDAMLKKAGVEPVKKKVDAKTSKIITPYVRKKFFSDITAQQMEEIYYKYVNDFLLFGYSLDIYSQ